MVALGQAHGAKDQPHRDPAGIIVDELERLALADAIERAIGDLERGRDQVLDVLAQECGLAERAQTIVAWRIGGPERRAGAAGNLVDHVALGGRECLPVARRLDDVVIARENPQLAALAPIAGKLLAQDFVIGKRIGIYFR